MVDENGSGYELTVDEIGVAILNPELLGKISSGSIENLENAHIDELGGSQIQMFLIRCFDSDHWERGLELAERTLDYCEELKHTGDEDKAREFLGRIVGGLGYGSDVIPKVREKILELMRHQDPWIIITAIEHLPRTTNPENFGEVCKLMLHADLFVRKGAIQYAEQSIVGAAFSDGNTKKEDIVYSFMEKALGPLESVYGELGERGSAPHIRKRLAILVAMIYNEVLDTLDTKETMGEPSTVTELVYFEYEHRLTEEIGLDALPFICKMLEHKKDLERVHVCALNTLGRMSNSRVHAERIVGWVKDYLGEERPSALINVARTILDARTQGQAFKSIPPVDPRKIIGGSIVPPRIKR